MRELDTKKINERNRSQSEELILAWEKGAQEREGERCTGEGRGEEQKIQSKTRNEYKLLKNCQL